MAWAWFFPAEKTLFAKIGFVFGEFSLESQATAKSVETLYAILTEEMKKHIILSLNFLFVLLLSSCERVYITKLRNSTETGLILEIILDKDSVNKYNNHLKESTIISFNNGGKLIKFDSTNYIATFLLKSKEEYAFEGGLGEKPKFTEISKINIYGKDTLRINSRAEMFKNFEEESNRQYVLEVK